MQSINSLVSGMQLVKTELERYKEAQEDAVAKNDRFAHVMQAFVGQFKPAIEALKNMGTSIEGELRSLLIFYGENPDSSEAPKPEDFFGLILSFSSSLQVSELLTGAKKCDV